MGRNVKRSDVVLLRDLPVLHKRAASRKNAFLSLAKSLPPEGAAIVCNRRITAGSEFAVQIDQHLDAADLILLLVRPYFIASE